MKIVVEGAPQSGKTTVSSVVKERYGLCYVSASEAIRTAVHLGNSAFSGTLHSLMEEDHAIPDTLLAKVVKEAVSRPDCSNGFVLDGFPRTKNQAALLKKEGVEVDAILELELSDKVAQSRFGGRWFHPGSLRRYHTTFNPPKEPMRDDITREPLEQSMDDLPEAITQRMLQYRRRMTEVRSVGSSKSAQWLSVDADGNLEAVRTNAFALLDPLYQVTNPPPKAGSSTTWRH